MYSVNKRGTPFLSKNKSDEIFVTFIFEVWKKSVPELVSKA
jgi:hypothetical protein